MAALALAVALAAAGALLWPGLVSMVQVWERSGTYNHGFFILPIALFLAWRNRIEWLPIAPRPYWLLLPVLLAIGLGWFAAAIVDLVGGEHAMVVAALIALLAFFAGPVVTRRWLFPLAYLVFAIPFGEALLPPLMAFTADFTVMALQLVGVPVYREGLYFSVPSGNWSVVEACSGLRYLIASLALGTLYAYLSYRSFTKRALFVLVSALVPILANGMRAFMIVMIGHWSNMQLAVGVDHYIYGWVFFALVTFLLFWVGNRWREDTEPVAAAAQPPVQGGSAPALVWTAALALALTALAAGPLAARWVEHRLAQAKPQTDFKRWDAFAGTAARFSSFKPHFTGERASWAREFVVQGRPLGLFAAHYAGQDQDHKLISSTNKLVPTTEHDLGVLSEARFAPGGELPEVIESEVREARQRLLAWHWYRVCGQDTVSPVWAKWLQLQCIGRHLRDEATVFVVYVPLEDRRDDARAALRTFLAQHRADLNAAVDAGRRSRP
jgi:exosortase A